MITNYKVFQDSNKRHEILSVLNDFVLSKISLSTGPRNNTCTWLQECCRQVEAEVVSNSRNQLH